jgi:hypothetical protein
MHGDYAGKRFVTDNWLYSPPIGNGAIAARVMAAVQDQSMRSLSFKATADNIGFTPSRHTYPLRGYPTGLNTLRGNALNLLSLEWRTHIANPQTSIMLPPIGLRRVYGKVFADAGRGWTWGQRPKEFSKSVGAELSLELIAAFRVPVELILGSAKGLDQYGEQQHYIRISIPN